MPLYDVNGVGRGEVVRVLVVRVLDRPRGGLDTLVRIASMTAASKATIFLEKHLVRDEDLIDRDILVPHLESLVDPRQHDVPAIVGREKIEGPRIVPENLLLHALEGARGNRFRATLGLPPTLSFIIPVLGRCHAFNLHRTVVHVNRFYHFHDGSLRPTQPSPATPRAPP